MDPKDIQNIIEQLEKHQAKLFSTCETNNPNAASLSNALGILRDLSNQNDSDNQLQKQRLSEATTQLKVISYNLSQISKQIKEAKDRLSDMHYNLYVEKERLGF